MSKKRKLTLEFEQPLLELEEKIEEFQRLARESDMRLDDEVELLQERALTIRAAIYENLTPAQRVQIARHSSRPSALDYIQAISEEFVELHGDRQGHDDLALVGGLARFGGRPVLFLGLQKGRDTKDNVLRNFGMAHPEGYRKALRLMRHADKFGLPVISLIDTPGAYPGVQAEEDCQGVAIAENLAAMARLSVPIVAAVIGEGSSGGALGIGLADRVLIFQHAYYGVISPEGCAAILWKDATKAPLAAKLLKLTAEELQVLGIVDEIVPEPLGGAHQDPVASAANLGDALRRHLDELCAVPAHTLVERRYEKYRRMGAYATEF